MGQHVHSGLDCADTECEFGGAPIIHSSLPTLEPWDMSLSTDELKVIRSAMVIAYSTLHGTSLQASLMGQQELSDVAHEAASKLDKLIDQMDRIIKSGNHVVVAPF